MAEAARTVRPYVSDCLQERHPYDVQKGFAGAASRDAGRAFKGFLPGGIDSSMQNLTDPSVSQEEKAKAARHLYAQSASQETKIALLEKDIVSVLVGVVRQCTLNVLEHQCFLLLRSLCVIPQGCYSVVYGGGIEVAVAALNRSFDRADRAEARAAAASVVQQVAFDFAGVRWLLQAEDCEEMRLRYELTSAVDAGNLVSTQDLLSCLTAVLQETDAESTPMGQSLISVMASMTAITPGIVGCLDCEPTLPTLKKHLVAIGNASAPPTGAAMQFAVPLLDTIWNVALDQSGVEALEALEVPEALLRLFALVCERSQSASTLLQRHLVGALSAVFKLTSLKHRCTEPLGQAPSLAVALMQYLRSVNEQVDVAKRAGKEPSKDIVAISKNTVQCIRLASEVKAVRTITHAHLDAMEAEGGNESFYFRRQLYYSTIWEKEYNASV